MPNLATVPLVRLGTLHLYGAIPTPYEAPIASHWRAPLYNVGWREPAKNLITKLSPEHWAYRYRVEGLEWEVKPLAHGAIELGTVRLPEGWLFRPEVYYQRALEMLEGLKHGQFVTPWEDVNSGPEIIPMVNGLPQLTDEIRASLKKALGEGE